MTCKRALDVVLSAAALLILMPAITLLWIAVRLTSRGPALYSHKRVGKGGVPFRAWKFRSMREDADSLLRHHLESDPLLRSEWERDHKLKNDPRVTAIGKFLRKTSLDELPQLWNVFSGDMTLVGPRPIVTAEIPRYGDALSYYLSVRPGITGLWQISGRNNTTYAERVCFDERYVKNWSLTLDLYILLRTVKTVLFGEGAY
jgi:Undecaprenyl-phosphate galactose phosphotransferase WbaP